MSAAAPSTLSFIEADVLSRPLCVDLDGTLVTTDTLGESLALLMRQRPWLVLALPFWLLRGRAGFKRAITDRVALDPAMLPYRKELIDALRACREQGRTLVLATAADARIAEGVARHLDLFDSVHASNGSRNLKSSAKAELLCRAYGKGGFDYIGDSGADAAIFEQAARGYLVGASRRAIGMARGLGNVSLVSRRPSLLRATIKELRIHQWSKNALVLLPIVLAPEIPPRHMVVRGLVAFMTLSLCASAGYVLNDLLDIEADRHHATKCRRPFASGALPVVAGMPLFVGLVGASFCAALKLVSPGFAMMQALYFVGTLSYSFYLKRQLLLDVLMLAGLFTLRIISGGVATAVHVSAWLLGFSMFLFTSLAFVKRYVELRTSGAGDKIKNRGYLKTDLEMVTSMGTASGYIAALVFMLYVESGAVRESYREPTLLWLVLPVLLYWLGRIWLLAGRKQMQDDPVKFAIKDVRSLICGAIIACVVALARFAPETWSAALH